MSLLTSFVTVLGTMLKYLTGDWFCRLEEGALGHVYVNFDANLVSMLRETRYFQLMADQLPTGIPDMAIKVETPPPLFEFQATYCCTWHEWQGCYHGMHFHLTDDQHFVRSLEY